MERMQWLQALSRGNDAQLAGRFLRDAWEEKVQTNEVDDFLETMKAFAQHDAQTRQQPVTWRYLRQNYGTMQKHYVSTDRRFGKIIESVQSFQQTQALMIQYPHAGAGAISRSRILEQLQRAIDWQQRHMHEIQHWIEQHS